MLAIDKIDLEKFRRLWETVRFAEDERKYGTYRALVMYGTRIGQRRRESDNGTG